MSGFTNLGDLIRRDRDLTQNRDRRSRRRTEPAGIHFRAARYDGERRRPRAGQARLATRRQDRAARRQPRRIYRSLLRHHARRLRRRAGEFQIPARHHSFHHPRLGRKARVLRCGARGGLPRRYSERDIRRGVRRLSRSWPVRRRDPGAGRAGDVSLHLRIDRHAEGRRALAPKPHLGGRDAAGAGARPPSLSDRRAALPHERAGAGKTRLRGACHHRAVAAIFRARLYRGDRKIPLHLAHRGAADDRHDAARNRGSQGDRSVQRRIRAHGLGAGQRRPDGGAARGAAARFGDQCLRHHRGRPGGVRAASQRFAAARAVGRLSASFGFAAPR